MNPSQKVNGATSRLPLVRIGVIGLGSDWQQSLSPAIEKMQARVRVVAVCDDVALSARAAAARWQADPILGVRSLLQRQDIDAVLLRSVGWQRDWLFGRLLDRKLPVLLGPEVALADKQVAAFHRSYVDDGTVMVPELPFRYMPATLRVRELLATTLGDVTQMLIHESAWNSQLVGSPPLDAILDWCTSLLDDVPTMIAPTVIERTTTQLAGLGGEGMSLTFESARGSIKSRSVVVLLQPDLNQKSVGDGTNQSALPFCELVCEQGAAVIESPIDLKWTVRGKTTHEQLLADRSSSEVVLDLFARRVMGGLIPTPDPGDLQRVRELVQAFQTARKGCCGVQLHNDLGL